jgi:hypothetical protein
MTVPAGCVHESHLLSREIMSPQSKNHPGILIESYGPPNPNRLQDLVYLRATNKISAEESWEAYDKIVEASIRSQGWLPRVFRRMCP